MPDPAVAELAPASPAETPIAEVYEQALKAQQGPPEPELKPEKPAKTPKPKGDKVTPEVTKAPTKPASALDAALETAPKGEDKPKEEASADPLAEFPEDAKEKNWKGLRGKAQEGWTLATTRETELKRLQGEVEVAKKGDPSAVDDLKVQLDKATKENESMRDAITAVNIELLPEFRAEFVDGRKELVNSAIEKLKAYGGNVSALQRALNLPEGKDRDEAVEAAFGEEGQMSESGKNKIRNIVSQIEAKDEAKAKRLADPQISFETYQQKQTASQKKAQEEAQATRQSQIERVLKTLPAKSPLFKTVDSTVPGAEEWNIEVEKTMSEVTRLLGPQVTLEEATEVAAKGKRFDALEKMFVATRTELANAKRQLAEFDGAQPDAKGTKAPAKTDAQAKLEKTPGQLYAETFSQLSGGGDIG